MHRRDIEGGHDHGLHAFSSRAPALHGHKEGWDTVRGMGALGRSWAALSDACPARAPTTRAAVHTSG